MSPKNEVASPFRDMGASAPGPRWALAVPPGGSSGFDCAVWGCEGELLSCDGGELLVSCLSELMSCCEGELLSCGGSVPSPGCVGDGISVHGGGAICSAVGECELCCDEPDCRGVSALNLGG